MNKQNSGPDIEVKALGAGCGVSMLMGFVTMMLLISVLALIGNRVSDPQTGLPLEVQFLGLILGYAGCAVTGYFTARASSQSPKLNVVLLGVILMVFGLSSFVFNKEAIDIGSVFAWAITIPAMLAGANVYERQANPRSGLQAARVVPPYDPERPWLPVDDEDNSSAPRVD